MDTDKVVQACLEDVWQTLATRSLRFFRPGQYTILAGIVLSNGDRDYKCISLGTGSKCLPQAHLPHAGEALHDSHAEVIARRGAIHWFLREMCQSNEYKSQWLLYSPDDRRWHLKESVQVHMYVSTLPCTSAILSDGGVSLIANPRRRCIDVIAVVRAGRTNGCSQIV